MREVIARREPRSTVPQLGWMVEDLELIMALELWNAPKVVAICEGGSIRLVSAFRENQGARGTLVDVNEGDPQLSHPLE